MFNVVGYEALDEDQVVALIKAVDREAIPDLEIIAKAVLIKDASSVVGMVSYGAIGDMAVVRYFLYDARISGTDLIVSLFFELYKKAYSEGIKTLVAGSPNENTNELFQMLGFAPVVEELPDEVKMQVGEDMQVMMINLNRPFEKG